MEITKRGKAQDAAREESSIEIIGYEELQPVSYEWTHDSNAHVLNIVDLSAFKKEDLRVEVDNLGKVIISGERRIGEGKYRRFKEVIEVPSDSIIEKISGKFENGSLSVIMPLREVGKREETRILSERVVELINKNKAVIAAAALGFLFGVYLTL